MLLPNSVTLGINMNEPTVTAEALNDLRQRYLDDKPWTREELKSAIHAMIGNRLSAVQEGPKTKAKATPVNLDDLLTPEVPKATEPSKAVTAIATETARVDATKENASNVPKNDHGGFF